jgi:fatty-acyl-CoA synthase
VTAVIDVPRRPALKSSRAWLRALELTAECAREPHRLIFDVIEELASLDGDKPALLSERECFSFRDLATRSSQYCKWALERGIKKGDVVGLLMTSRPEYFALWVGISTAGGVVALLNINLQGSSLAHCVNVVQPKHIIVASELADSLSSALPTLSCEPDIWIHGVDHASFRRIDVVISGLPRTLIASKRPRLSVDDLALYIYTSGTTGLPKAAKVTHGRIIQWSHWFAGMLNVQPEDRMYDCLPMYHSIGGVLVPGATLVAGGSVVIREAFSAGQFWSDVVRWDCTMFQYIGEFCRYLCCTAPSPIEQNHRIRIACGNGLSPDVWPEFKERFRIPQILEFYASTEGGLSLFNVEGKPGSIGRVPSYLAHRFSPTLVRFDPEKSEPIRNVEGFCIGCAPNEPGEALARILRDPSQAGSRFEGYTDAGASEKKLLRDVFEPGDVWVRTGDLMRKDAQGFYYFVDRIGDTFRWKGENVATTEVAEAISSFPSVQHAVVYGVKLTNAEGRVGMAAVTFEGHPDLLALRRHLIQRLPPYARPVFFMVREDCKVTGTFKYSKADLAAQGFNPDSTSDAIYFDNPETQTLQPVDQVLYARIQSGQIRL